MKKNLKMMAVLSAAAVMTVAAPEMGFTAGSSIAYAKTIGWVEENGSFKYYEEDDYFLTDTWKKRGEDWYYLNEEGEIATNAQIDEYYVDETGKRVMDQWISIENEDAWDSPDAAEYHWYYYGKNGKAAVSKWQKVGESWYYFNEDGQMMTGKVEIDNATYYLGEANDGVMKTGWIQLENESDDPEMTHSWYYFDTNGKMVENQVDKKISGDYYTFVDGVMQTGWFKLPAEENAENATPSDAAENTATTVAGYQYYEPENGKRVTGWRTIEGVEGISAEGELYNFYFKNGKPYHADNGLQLFTVESKNIAQESSVDDIVKKILEFQTHSDHVEGARNKISVLKDYFLLNKICRRLLKIINYVDNKTEEKIEHIDIKCDLTDVKKFLSTLFSDLIDYDENSNVKHILEVQQDQLEESILAIEDKNTVISYQEIELARLSGIENSTIWKASKPLRKTLDIIKKILK